MYNYTLFISENSYNSKEDCLNSHKKLDKYTLCKVPESNIRETILSAYKSGHIFNICDFNYSPLYILDLDHLSQTQKDLIYTKSWQDQIIAKYNFDAIDVLPSASKNPFKAKIFCWKKHEREFKLNDKNQWNNIDNSHKLFLSKFKQDNNIEVDDRMNIYNQLTYPSKLTNNQFDFSNIIIQKTKCRPTKRIKQYLL